MRVVLFLLLCSAAVFPAFPETLHEAVLKDDLSALARILRTSPPGIVNIGTAGGVSPLHLAAALNRVPIAVYLMLHGANPEAPTENGFTPLHWAAARDSVEVLQLLLARGANPNHGARAGITPLHWAAAQNATNAVRALLRAGADCTAKTTEGFTPLHWALSHGARTAATILAHELTSLNTTNVATRATVAPGEAPLLPTGPVGPFRSVAVALPQGLPLPVPGNIFSIPIGFGETLSFVWIEPLKLWVGRTEVTNGQYRRFNPHHDSRSRGKYGLNGADQPAVYVSWFEAKAFCDWLTLTFSSQLPPKSECRLPTAAEWTALARCGTARTYPWGNTWPPTCGNFADITARSTFSDMPIIEEYDDGHPVTAPVWESGTNEWGLAGMGGNVWEWCEDWYDGDHKYKKRMGGAWDTAQPTALRTDYCGFDLPSTRDDTIGFRVVIATGRGASSPGAIGANSPGAVDLSPEP